MSAAPRDVGIRFLLRNNEKSNQVRFSGASIENRTWFDFSLR
jgi:hypothetical protein